MILHENCRIYNFLELNMLLEIVFRKTSTLNWNVKTRIKISEMILREDTGWGQWWAVSASPHADTSAGLAFRFDELITTDGRGPGGGSARGPRPFGEIDLRNAPEIAFFRRRGRIPLRAIRAPRARASRRAPFWGLRCVRCGERSLCGPSRLPLSPKRRRSASARTPGAAAVSAAANSRAWSASRLNTASASTQRPPVLPACVCATSPNTKTSKRCASDQSTLTSTK